MKISQLIFLQILAAAPFVSRAQITPMFEMPLYFEDAVGNKDTLVVGYDTLGSYDVLLPQFGEVAITTPFDSVFEVRAIHDDVIFVNSKQTSNRIIANYDLWAPGLSCGISADVVIIVKAKYPPIRISYDSTLLRGSECRTNTILSPNWDIHLLQFWWDAFEYHCMGASSSIVDDLYYPEVNANWLTVKVPVEGHGLVELPGYFMEFRDWGACTDSTLIGVHQPLEKDGGHLWPNPASDQVSIQPQSSFGNVQTLEVFNTIGQLLPCAYTTDNQGIKIDIRALSTGLYFVKIQSEKERSTVYRFTKG